MGRGVARRTLPSLLIVLLLLASSPSRRLVSAAFALRDPPLPATTMILGREQQTRKQQLPRICPLEGRNQNPFPKSRSNALFLWKHPPQDENENAKDAETNEDEEGAVLIMERVVAGASITLGHTIFIWGLVGLILFDLVLSNFPVHLYVRVY